MHVSNQWFKINQNHLTFYWQIWNSQERAIKTSQCFTIQQTSGLIVMALAQTEVSIKRRKFKRLLYTNMLISKQSC